MVIERNTARNSIGLPLAAKQAVATRIERGTSCIQLDRNWTDDINSGKINVTELAFAVEGQASEASCTISAASKPGRAGCAVC